MSSTQPSTPLLAEQHTKQGRQLWPRLLIAIFLGAALLIGWQLLSTGNSGTDPTVAGRPLSNPQMHLHTVAIGGKPGTLYLGTHYGIFTSTDSGRTWPQTRGTLNTLMVTSIVTSPKDAASLALAGLPSTTGGSSAGVYFSQDGGITWNLRNPPNLLQGAYPYTIQAGSANSQHFYAFYLYTGWFETRDMGQHWRPFAQETLSKMLTPSLLTFADNPNHLLLGGDQGLFESMDDGQTWSVRSSVQGFVSTLVATRTQPTTIFCSTDQGLYTWKDGTTQIKQIPLPNSITFSRFASDTTGNMLYGLAGRNLWYSQNGGSTWTHEKYFDRGDFSAFLVDPQQPARLYVGFFLPPQVLQSRDHGLTWHILTDANSP